MTAEGALVVLFLGCFVAGWMSAALLVARRLRAVRTEVRALRQELAREREELFKLLDLAR